MTHRDLERALFHLRKAEEALGDWWRALLAESGMPSVKPIDAFVKVRELRAEVEVLAEVTEVGG